MIVIGTNARNRLVWLIKFPLILTAVSWLIYCIIVNVFVCLFVSICFVLLTITSSLSSPVCFSVLYTYFILWKNTSDIFRYQGVNHYFVQNIINKGIVITAMSSSTSLFLFLFLYLPSFYSSSNPFFLSSLQFPCFLSLPPPTSCFRISFPFPPCLLPPSPPRPPIFTTTTIFRERWGFINRERFQVYFFCLESKMQKYGKKYKSTNAFSLFIHNIIVSFKFHHICSRLYSCHRLYLLLKTISPAKDTFLSRYQRSIGLLVLRVTNAHSTFLATQKGLKLYSFLPFLQR